MLLDFSLPVFNLSQAQKGPYTSNASVIVDVQEINLHPPTFDIMSATGYISEDASPETQVTFDLSGLNPLIIQARDLDLDPVSHVILM